MITLKQWLEDAQRETEEEIILIVLFGEDRWYGTPIDLKPWQDQLLRIEDVPEEVLTREFSDGFGGTEGPDFTAWSKNYVFFPDQYDGAESVCWMPRNPIVMKNFKRPGGG